MAKSSSKASYESYIAQFHAKKAKFDRWNLMHPDKPQRFHDPAPLSRIEFQTVYAGERNRRKEDVALGNRKSVGNVTRAIVEAQAHAITQAQAKAYAEAAYQSALALNRRKRKKNRVDEAKIAKPISVREARRDPELAKRHIDFDSISKMYYKLKERGMDPSAARTEISHRWFGS